jgi:hypothetical protein
MGFQSVFFESMKKPEIFSFVEIQGNAGGGSNGCKQFVRNIFHKFHSAIRMVCIMKKQDKPLVY